MHGRQKLFEKDDVFSDLFFEKLEKLIYFYDGKKYGDFLELYGKIGFKLTNHKQKLEIYNKIEHLKQIRNQDTIGQILDYVFECQLLSKPPRLKDLEKNISKIDLDDKMEKKKKFYDELMAVSYQEVINVYDFLENKTPFSTKHGVKGAEFDNVLVVVDDNSWQNSYNFENILKGEDKSQARYLRSLNLFYVCCSRAKNRLAVLFLSKIGADSINKAIEWFGKENICDVATL